MESMEQIYREHSKLVYRYLLSLTHNEELAEELTQETFYQAVKSIGSFKGGCRVSTWLCAIAKNQLAAWQRKNPRRKQLAGDCGSTAAARRKAGKTDGDGDLLTGSTEGVSTSAEQDVLAQLEKIELMKKLHDLEEPFREVMYLRIFGELSFREIGEILQRTENWARVNFYRGKERLRSEVDNGG